MVGYTLLSNLAGKVLGTLLGNLPGTLNVKARARRSWRKRCVTPVESKKGTKGLELSKSLLQSMIRVTSKDLETPFDVF